VLLVLMRLLLVLVLLGQCRQQQQRQQQKVKAKWGRSAGSPHSLTGCIPHVLCPGGRRSSAQAPRCQRRSAQLYVMALVLTGATSRGRMRLAGTRAGTSGGSRSSRCWVWRSLPVLRQQQRQQLKRQRQQLKRQRHQQQQQVKRQRPQQQQQVELQRQVALRRLQVV
jgi:hypothetical protein